MKSGPSALRDFTVDRRAWLLSGVAIFIGTGRLAEQGAVARRHNEEDHREVFIELTTHEEELLHRLSDLLWQELSVTGPALAVSLLAVVNHSFEIRRGPE
jgi:hypothetical protein